MEQLSGQDNIFLISEQRNVYNHVAMLLIYDVSTAPEGKVRFKDILRHFDQRLYAHPIFRRRLVTVPFGIDRPYWVADAEIDLEFHIRHIALPKPGDWRQLMIQVARLHSRPLDRGHPLWEAYVIEGLDAIPKLPPGSFALFMKFHHASIDGMAGIHLATQLHATTPDTSVAATRTVVRVDRNPSAIEYVSRALGNGLSRWVDFGKLSARVAGKAVELGAEQVAGTLGGASFGELSRAAPATRFNKHVSPHRVVEGFGMPLSRIKRIRAKIPGATLNDVFLAVAGGGVRKYLLAKHELPERSLVSLMPMALRSDASAGGNAVGTAFVKVRSDIPDHVERLQAVHLEAQNAKDQAEKLGTDMMRDVLNVLPSSFASALVTRLLLPQINMTVSNVRGPDHALYLAGAKAMCLYPVSIPSDGAGLNVTGVSYNGVMWVSLVSCRDMVPDPGLFLSALKETWDELLAQADGLPEADTVASKGKAPLRKKAKASTKKTEETHAHVRP